MGLVAGAILMSSNYQSQASKELEDWTHTVHEWNTQVLQEFNGTAWALHLTNAQSGKETRVPLTTHNTVRTSMSVL